MDRPTKVVSVLYLLRIQSSTAAIQLIINISLLLLTSTLLLTVNNVIRGVYVFRQDTLDTTGHKGFVTRGIALTVLSDRRFVVFRMREKRPMTLDSFEAFLQACWTQGAKGLPLEGSRAGVLHIQRAHGLPQFAEDARSRRAIKGFSYSHKLVGLPRGSITDAML